MNTLKNFGIKMLTASVLTVLGGSAMAADIHSALSDSKAWADLNLRYEAVDQDNALEDASALTLRTRLGFSSGSVNGFSFTAEVEDSRIVLGQDEFTVGPTGFNVATIGEILDIELPRPRDRLALADNKQYNHYRHEVLTFLYDKQKKVETVSSRANQAPTTNKHSQQLAKPSGVSSEKKDAKKSDAA